MDVDVRKLAAAQEDIVAAWQLLAAGATQRMIIHRIRHRGWRVIHPGVYALTQSPLTRRQLWIAATLTTEDSVLSHASAAACWGFRPIEEHFQTITRPGSGGPRRLGRLLVLRSTTLQGDTTMHDGIKITTAARTLIDVAPGLSSKATGRAFREALRLKVTTLHGLDAAVARHRGRPGTPLLRELARRYSSVSYDRARSDAEGRALELLLDAGVEPPAMNVRIDGEEADLVWRQRRLIVEIDGPQYHQFRDEDLRKQRRWESAGYEVRRIASNVVYNQPALFIAVVLADEG
jgi:Protein of unknown function (DUF559)